MIRDEARQILNQEMDRLSALPYSFFKNWVDTKHVEVLTRTGQSGAEYQLEIESHWDGKEGGSLRVLIGIDDGHFHGAFKPLSVDFIIAPNTAAP